MTYERRVKAITETYTVGYGGGDLPITFTVPEFTVIEIVLNYKIITDPEVSSGCIGGEKIEGKVVGATLYGVPTGTTVTATVEILGY